MDNLRDFSSQTGTDTKTDVGTDTETAAGMDLEHPRLSHYRLERELGRGFSSIVYEATDERRQRAVALKVLTFLQTLSEERRVDLAERFRREAQAVSILSHPNIVAIYEVGHADDGRQYIAMECLPGETLRQRLHRSSPLTVPEAVAIAVRVADALHYAHGRGIVHRDIKPDNIFLAGSAGSEPTPKLMDFGIAHVLSDQGLTQDGTIVGSPAYMSPEQINGQPLDARTDIFSLAVTVTEMVTGAKPFVGETIPAVMQQILRHMPDLRAVPDRRLERILTKALSKNPSARYPDAAAFAEALRQAAPLAAAPSVATQVITGVHQRPVAAFRRQRYARLGAVGLWGLALAALIALPLVAKRPSAPAYAAVPASSSSPQPLPSATPVPLTLGSGTRRREIAAAWHPAKPRSVHPAQSADMVRIAEVTPMVTPARHHFSFDAHPARIPFVAHPPRASFASRASFAPSLPAAPALPVKANPLGTPRMASTDPAHPIVRVAGVRQELTPAGKTASDAVPETEPMPDRETPPPPLRAQSTTNPADAPPHPVHCPMPSALAAPDSPNVAVRLRLSVDEDGDVTEATILTSSGSRELDDAALDAVGHWEYDPAIKNGRRVPDVVFETVRFSRRQ